MHRRQRSHRWFRVSDFAQTALTARHRPSQARDASTPGSRSATGNSVRIIQSMLVRLAELTKLRLVLQAAAHEFTAEAEDHPNTPVTLMHLRVAAQIKELDCQIGVLTDKLSHGQPRRRTADKMRKARGWSSRVKKHFSLKIRQTFRNLNL